MNPFPVMINSICVLLQTFLLVLLYGIQNNILMTQGKKLKSIKTGIYAAIAIIVIAAGALYGASSYMLDY